MRRLAPWLAAVLIAVALFIGLFAVFQRRMMYFPAAEVGPIPATLPGATEIAFPTEDGLRLTGWWIPAGEPRAGWTALVFNGNGGNRGDRVDLARAFQTRGLNTLVFDYRGYGGNPGDPSEDGLARDARAARAFLRGLAPDGDRLAYFGESLGGAVAVRLAVEARPDALILRSPFTSMIAMGRLHYPYLPIDWLLADRYPSETRIAQVGAPTLVVAGAGDQLVPPAQSRALYDRAAEPKRFVLVPGAGHNDRALADGPLLINALMEFLRDVDSRRH